MERGAHLVEEDVFAVVGISDVDIIPDQPVLRDAMLEAERFPELVANCAQGPPPQTISTISATAGASLPLQLCCCTGCELRIDRGQQSAALLGKR